MVGGRKTVCYEQLFSDLTFYGKDGDKRLAFFLAQFRRVKLVRVRIPDCEDPVVSGRAALIAYHAKRRRPFAVVLQRKEHICAVELDELLRFVTQSALADD